MRKIIHIDMDCFYAAIEERENPALRGKPVAVAGRERRSVLTTANYEARKYGCRSAMPVFKALELCPQLIVVPVQFDLYHTVSDQIRGIFGRFTELVERFRSTRPISMSPTSNPPPPSLPVRFAPRSTRKPASLPRPASRPTS